MERVLGFFARVRGGDLASSSASIAVHLVRELKIAQAKKKDLFSRGTSSHRGMIIARELAMKREPKLGACIPAPHL